MELHYIHCENLVQLAYNDMEGHDISVCKSVRNAKIIEVKFRERFYCIRRFLIINILLTAKIFK